MVRVCVILSIISKSQLGKKHEFEFDVKIEIFVLFLSLCIFSIFFFKYNTHTGSRCRVDYPMKDVFFISIIFVDSWTFGAEYS